MERYHTQLAIDCVSTSTSGHTRFVYLVTGTLYQSVRICFMGSAGAVFDPCGVGTRGWWIGLDGETGRFTGEKTSSSHHKF